MEAASPVVLFVFCSHAKGRESYVYVAQNIYNMSAKTRHTQLDR